MASFSFGSQRSRRDYLKVISVLGGGALATVGLVRTTQRNGSSENDDVEGTLYAPPEDAPAPGAMYPRVVRLEEADSAGTTLLATFENYPSMSGGSEPYFPVYRSTNGGQTWAKFSEIHDQSGKGWGLRYQPTLYELPQQTGPWEAGTVLAAGNAIPIVDGSDGVDSGDIGQLGDTSIDLYASTDRGESWDYVSTVATGGPAYPHAGHSPVWEPELRLDAEGHLICYYADERQGSNDDYNQLVGFKVSEDGGQTWGDEEFVTAVPNETDRPGMPSIAKSPDGSYVIAYEVVGSDTVDGEIRVKTSPDGRNWGDPTELGRQVTTENGHRFVNGPYITWTPRGGSDGTLLVSGKQLVDSNRNLVDGNGEVVLTNTNPNGERSWIPVEAPLSFETESDLGGRVYVGWTTPLLPTADGENLLQLTSTAMNDELCEIRYAKRSLELDAL